MSLALFHAFPFRFGRRRAPVVARGFALPPEGAETGRWRRLVRLGGAMLCGCMAAAGAQPETAPAWRIPPLDGELEGDFRPLTVPGAPGVHWKLNLKPGQTRQRVGQLAIDGPGTRVRAELQLDVSGNGTWRVEEAAIDVGTWSAAAVGFLGDEFAAAKARGQLVLEGEGTLREGVVGGRARLTLRNGGVDDPARKLRLDGVALTLELQDIATRRSAPRQSLTWDGGNYESIPFGLGHVDFSLAGEQVNVEEASVEVFGGEIVIAAFSFSTLRREASVIARVVGIEVSHILKFLPPVLASAQGRVDGSIALHRTPAGVQIGGGTLALRAGETANLRLAPTPGLLSNSLPETVLKVYPGLGKIETGEVPLRAEQMEVTFTPGGDAQGRTAAIRIVGGPMDPRLRAPVDLNINIRGPLEQLIKFGTDSRLKFGGKP